MVPGLWHPAGRFASETRELFDSHEDSGRGGVSSLEDIVLDIAALHMRS